MAWPTFVPSLKNSTAVSVRPTAADITHSLAVFLIDANGNERAGFLPPLDVHAVARDVRMLQREAARNG